MVEITLEQMVRANALCESRVGPDGTFLHARERYRSPKPSTACDACRAEITRNEAQQLAAMLREMTEWVKVDGSLLVTEADEKRILRAAELLAHYAGA